MDSPLFVRIFLYSFIISSISFKVNAFLNYFKTIYKMFHVKQKTGAKAHPHGFT